MLKVVRRTTQKNLETHDDELKSYTHFQPSTAGVVSYLFELLIFQCVQQCLGVTLTYGHEHVCMCVELVVVVAGVATLLSWWAS
jgi:hypothetical protein